MDANLNCYPKKNIGEQKLGEILVSNGLIEKSDLEYALKKENLPLKPFIKILIDENKIKENELVDFLCKFYKIEYVDINAVDIPKNVINIIPPDKVLKCRVIPYKIENGNLYLAAYDPSRIDVADDIGFLAGFPALYSVSSYSQIINAMSKYYNASFLLDNFKKDENSSKTLAEESEISDITKDKVSESAVEKFINKVISDAVERGASDIHIENYRKFSRIRFRIDGKLIGYANISSTAKSNIVSVIKIKCEPNLDISEKRFPQDGRISTSVSGQEIDLRVSLAPTLFGEKIVMRILNKSSLIFDINRVGFSPAHLNILKSAINKPFGMILVTGPTGSGKTTTLYSILSELNKNESINISTAEDPIEYDFSGINQIQIDETLKNSKTGATLNFAEVLRSFLRQDPDIIMVGEIRDFETSSIAIQAALTGHLVLSTIHTNNASATVTRLINMNIEPFLISSSLNLIIAQRLIRKLCLECKEELDESAIKKLGISAAVYNDNGNSGGERQNKNNYFKLYKAKPKGCPTCNNTGYKGRIPIYEMLEINDEIRGLINGNASESEIERSAIKNGMKTLSDSAKEKFLSGVTSLEEILPYIKKQ
ncbi:MAG: GspE/PulE family protein [Candidatus Acidulodesulfobacterium sp.]